MHRFLFLVPCFTFFCYSNAQLECKDGPCYFDVDTEYIEKNDNKYKFVPFQTKSELIANLHREQGAALERMNLQKGNKVKLRVYGFFTLVLEVNGKPLPKFKSCDGIHPGDNFSLKLKRKCVLTNQIYFLPYGFEFENYTKKTLEWDFIGPCIFSDAVLDKRQLIQLNQAFEQGKVRIGDELNVTTRTYDSIEFCKTDFIDALDFTAFDERYNVDAADLYKNYQLWQEQKNKSRDCGLDKTPCYAEYDAEYRGATTTKNYYNQPCLRVYSEEHFEHCYTWDRMNIDQRKLLQNTSAGHKLKVRDYKDFYVFTQLDGKAVFPEPSSCDGKHFGAHLDIDFGGLCDGGIKSNDIANYTYKYSNGCLWMGGFKSERQYNELLKGFSDKKLKIGDKIKVLINGNTVEICANSYIGAYNYAFEDNNSVTPFKHEDEFFRVE